MQCSQVSLHPDTGCRTGAAQINLSARGSRGADRTHIVLRSWSSAKKTHLLSMLAQPWQHTALYLLSSAWHTINLLHEDPRRPAYVNFTYMHPSSSVICAATSAPSFPSYRELIVERQSSAYVEAIRNRVFELPSNAKSIVYVGAPPQHTISGILSCVADYDFRRTPLQWRMRPLSETLDHFRLGDDARSVDVP